MDEYPRYNKQKTVEARTYVSDLLWQLKDEMIKIGYVLLMNSEEAILFVAVLLLSGINLNNQSNHFLMDSESYVIMKESMGFHALEKIINDYELGTVEQRLNMTNMTILEIILKFFKGISEEVISSGDKRQTTELLRRLKVRLLSFGSTEDLDSECNVLYELVSNLPGSISYFGSPTFKKRNSGCFKSTKIKLAYHVLETFIRKNGIGYEQRNKMSRKNILLTMVDFLDYSLNQSSSEKHYRKTKSIVNTIGFLISPEYKNKGMAPILMGAVNFLTGIDMEQTHKSKPRNKIISDAVEILRNLVKDLVDESQSGKLTRADIFEIVIDRLRELNPAASSQQVTEVVDGDERDDIDEICEIDTGKPDTDEIKTRIYRSTVNHLINKFRSKVDTGRQKTLWSLLDNLVKTMCNIKVEDFIYQGKKKNRDGTFKRANKRANYEEKREMAYLCLNEMIMKYQLGTVSQRVNLTNDMRLFISLQAFQALECPVTPPYPINLLSEEISEGVLDSNIDPLFDYNFPEDIEVQFFEYYVQTSEDSDQYCFMEPEYIISDQTYEKTFVSINNSEQTVDMEIDFQFSANYNDIPVDQNDQQPCSSNSIPEFYSFSKATPYSNVVYEEIVSEEDQYELVPYDASFNDNNDFRIVEEPVNQFSSYQDVQFDVPQFYNNTDSQNDGFLNPNDTAYQCSSNYAQDPVSQDYRAESPWFQGVDVFCDDNEDGQLNVDQSNTYSEPIEYDNNYIFGTEEVLFPELLDLDNQKKVH